MFAGSGGSLWHLFNNGSPTWSWDTGNPFGGSLSSSPSAASWGLNHIDIMATTGTFLGGGNQLEHLWFDNVSWSSWNQARSLSVGAP